MEPLTQAEIESLNEGHRNLDAFMNRHSWERGNAIPLSSRQALWVHQLLEAFPKLLAELRMLRDDKQRLESVIAMMHLTSRCMLTMIRRDASGNDLAFAARQEDIDNIATRLYPMPLPTWPEHPEVAAMQSTTQTEQSHVD